MQSRATATLRYLRIAPRKVRSVAGLIRRRSLQEAEAQLMLERRRGAQALLKLLRSARANAKDMKMDAEKLYVESISVDQGPMLKRILPRARGSASPIQKKMSHVTLVLAESQHPLPPRFTILQKKKEKASAAPRTAKRAHEHTEEETRKEKPKAGRGFFRRIFSRKSGMGA